jgi:hypothetical protein
MSIYIPFSGSTASFITNLDHVKEVIDVKSENVIKLVENNQIQLPTSLQQLDREKIDIIDISVDAALALSISFGATDNKISRRVFIQEYKKYKEITSNDEVLHYGISIRWIVNIKKLNSSANISSLPMVTASAQFNNLSASVSFEVVGISSSLITPLMPTNVDLKSDTYVDLKNAFEEIKGKIWDTSTTITPSVLGIFGSVRSDDEKIFNDAVAITYALNNIKRGRNLNRALADVASKSDSVKEIVKSTYEEITKTSDLNVDPSDSAKNKAKQILNNLI